ncbi:MULTISPECIES: STAS domain-containing protein [Mycobacterium]|uniref:Anti-sigma factor antagonist n=1 Tax=Mycobacterium kiyosense TaxID=2871094 RepID=A0A9P3Q7T8_9MYCO|nr:MULTISPECIES: STAS domain-containing protein [Mycobacterium]BDB40295.1 anti-sigma factor antagonist [Mycobacterium kiyosense]BDE12117.1 anti-sigma factor antagonist [Mycobacterium sp. 20KCMC460]GLB83858.1 anti-sigma factor antagonist [Mycobacterium kiyosense]GLB88728.1 anti-sigma factor antagonist [Mycobacterium kiyosense]GLB95002.1 anti-sigma factor antagonist [Mycobacterium kiyosense]
MELLEVAHESGEAAVIVHVRGDVDTSTVDQLRQAGTAALRMAAGHPARLLILDLQAVNFFGSAGLNAVLDCHEAGATAGTTVRVVADHSRVLQPIQVTELDRVLDISPSLSDALRR